MKMPQHKCYFGCVDGVPVHRFPHFIGYKQEMFQRNRYETWKKVLDADTLAKGEKYIKMNIFLCSNHFEDCYKLCSGLLTKNAVPTLCLGGILHIFPNPDKNPAQHKAWVRIVSGDQDNESFDYTKARVCDRHFTDRDKNRNNRLNALAVPSLFLTQTETASGDFNQAEDVEDSSNSVDESIRFKGQTNVQETSDVQNESKVQNEADVQNKADVKNKPYVQSNKDIDLRDDSIADVFSNHINVGEFSNEVTVEEFINKKTVEEFSHDVTVQNVNDEAECTQTSPKDDVLPEVDNVMCDELEDEDYISYPKRQLFSWQGPRDVFQIQPEDVESIPESLSLYCDNGESAYDGQKDLNYGDISTVHGEFRCNSCNDAITGFRYTCVQCSDLDLCGACEARGEHRHHYVLRVPAAKPIAEVQLVLATIRRYLMRKLDPIKQTNQDLDDLVSIKSEVKSESEDENDDHYSSDEEARKTPPVYDAVEDSESPLRTEGDEFDVEDCSTNTKVEKENILPLKQYTSSMKRAELTAKKEILIKRKNIIDAKDVQPTAKKIRLLALPKRKLDREVDCPELQIKQKSIQRHMKVAGVSSKVKVTSHAPNTRTADTIPVKSADVSRTRLSGDLQNLKVKTVLSTDKLGSNLKKVKVPGNLLTMKTADTFTKEQHADRSTRTNISDDLRNMKDRAGSSNITVDRNLPTIDITDDFPTRFTNTFSKGERASDFSKTNIPSDLNNIKDTAESSNTVASRTSPVTIDLTKTRTANTFTEEADDASITKVTEVSQRNKTPEHLSKSKPVTEITNVTVGSNVEKKNSRNLPIIKLSRDMPRVKLLAVPNRTRIAGSEIKIAQVWPKTCETGTNVEGVSPQMININTNPQVSNAQVQNSVALVQSGNNVVNMNAKINTKVTQPLDRVENTQPKTNSAVTTPKIRVVNFPSTLQATRVQEEFILPDVKFDTTECSVRLQRLPPELFGSALSESSEQNLASNDGNNDRTATERADLEEFLDTGPDEGRRLASDLGENTRVYSYDRCPVIPDCSVRLARLPEAIMNFTRTMSSQERGLSDEAWDISDDNDR